ncbi:MAG: hypothetical protein L0K86_13960 [Actinomycetia bacterium]|nr:hypothetical protein [Actinomycetes bacterium]
MDAITVQLLDQIEAALTKQMIEVFGLDTHALILDMTNFATFIDSGNQRASIAAVAAQPSIMIIKLMTRSS